MTMRTIKAWALVFRDSRSEWSHPAHVHRTQREVKASFLSYYRTETGNAAWREGIADGSMRLARVTISEDTP
jgi:hypothetical protein